jgi:sugar phosphate isomerase/epimerase
MSAELDRSRRDLLKFAIAAAAAGPLASRAFAADAPKALSASPELIKPSEPFAGPDRFKGLKVGVASYTFHALPLDVAIKGIKRVGVHYCSIKDAHLPMKSTAEERKKVAEAFKAAGITPLSAGNISLGTDEAANRNAFEYVRDIGASVMVCAPKSVEILPALEKLVKEFDIRMAIHNHGPEDKTFPSPYEVQKAVEKLDKRIGYCIDLGHTFRAGKDPAQSIRDCQDRLYDIHIKDVAPVPAAPAAAGEPPKKPKSPWVVTEMGRGVMDIKAIIQALLEVKFNGHVGFEFEKDATDPLPGLAESVGYLRGVIAGL